MPAQINSVTKPSLLILIILFWVLLILQSTPTYQNQFQAEHEEKGSVLATGVLDLQVGAGADSVWHRGGDHTFFVTAGLIAVGNNASSGTYTKFGGAARFTNLTTPQGAIITSAYLTFRARWSNSGTVVRSNIFAEDVDNAARINSDADWHSRIAASTTAVVAWDNIPAWTEDTDYQSPSIVSVIQEIVDRPGWASEAINIFWDDDGSDLGKDIYRHADAFNSADPLAEPPKLHIEYQFDSPNPPDIVSSATPDGGYVNSVSDPIVSLKIRDNGPAGTYPNTYHWNQFQLYKDDGDGTFNTGTDFFVGDNFESQLPMVEDPPGGEVETTYWIGGETSGQIFFWRARLNNSGSDFSSAPAGSISPWSSAWSFTVDNDPPTSTINQPPCDSAAGPTSISGTSSDALSGVAQTAIAIQRQNDGFYWDWGTTAWTSSGSPLWSYATGTTSWSIDTSAVAWVAGQDYTVLSSAEDNVIGNFNQENPPASLLFTVSTCDLQITDITYVPVSDATNPTESGVTISASVSVKNFGAVNISSSFDVGFCWDNSSSSNCTATTLSPESIPNGISAGGTEIVMFSFTAPTVAGLTNYTGKATADPGDIISESEEDNNELTATYFVIPEQPDPYIVTTGSDVGARGGIDMDPPPASPPIPGVQVSMSGGIAVGPDGFSILIYQNQDGIKLAHCLNVNCTQRNITTVGDGRLSIGNSLVLGDDGYPRLVYRQYVLGDSNIQYARCLNPDCTDRYITIVDTDGDLGSPGLSIALLNLGDGDPNNDFPLISYSDTTSGDRRLKYAHCLDLDCESRNITVVSPHSTPNVYNSIAIGPDGYARISFNGFGTTHLDYIRCLNLDCTSRNRTQITPVGRGWWSSIALDDSGLARISYWKWGDPDSVEQVRCLDDDCGDRIISTVETGLDYNLSGSHIALANLGNGDPSDDEARMVYYDHEQIDLRYARCLNINCTDTPTTTSSVVNLMSSATSSISSAASFSTSTTANTSGESTSINNASSTTDAVATVPIDDPAADFTIYINHALALDESDLARISYKWGSTPDKILRHARCLDENCESQIITTVDGEDFPGSSEPSADYLVIADQSITNFYSAVGWLVESYDISSGGINTGFTSGDEFDELWDQFGAGATDATNRVIPDARGVYAYPSAAAIEGGPPTPQTEDFTWDGTGTPPTTDDAVVLFINGNLKIDANLILGNKKVAFIVRGNVNVKGLGSCTSVVNDRVVVRADDGKITNDTVFDNTLSVVEVGADGAGNKYDAFYRFSGFTIPQGATIQEAYVSVRNSMSGLNPETKLSADSSSGSPTSPTTAVDFEGRSRTTNGVDWDPTSGIRSYYDSPSIVPVVQELVDNFEVTSILILHDDDGSPMEWLRFLQWDGNYLPPRIHIEYTIPSVGSCSGVLDLDIAEWEDDAWQESGTVHMNIPILLGAPSVWAGFRFPDVGGLAGATIDKAELQVYLPDTTDDFPYEEIYAEDAESPLSFESDSYNITDRPRTSASVIWDTGGVGLDTGWETTPDLSPIIQKLADSYDPTDIVILFRHNSFQDLELGVREQFDGGRAAKLHIEYSGPGAVSNVDGFFVAGGTFNSGVAEAPIAGDCPECQLIVNGGVIAFGGVNLGRNLGISSATDPAEIFNYDPAYLYIFAAAPAGGKSLLGEDKGSFKELPP